MAFQLYFHVQNCILQFIGLCTRKELSDLSSGDSCKLNLRLKDAARIGSVNRAVDRARFRSEI